MKIEFETKKNDLKKTGNFRKNKQFCLLSKNWLFGNVSVLYWLNRCYQNSTFWLEYRFFKVNRNDKTGDCY